jgi:uncharacterized membrane protein YphA (DoxX/SURF4 family)
MKCCEMESKDLFVLSSRLLFGAWLLYLGLSKIFILGPETFVGYINAEFAKTWSPPVLTTLLAWLILIAEPILGALLILGRKLRCVWMLTALLMFTLMFGQTLLQKFDVVFNNWAYTIFCIACASMAKKEDSSCCSSKTSCCS